jgi:hypothetical protein
MPHREPWDGQEPITDVLERFALRADFQEAVDGRDRTRAVGILGEVGVDEETAVRMIEILIPSEESDH